MAKLLLEIRPIGFTEANKYAYDRCFRNTDEVKLQIFKEQGSYIESAWRYVDKIAAASGYENLVRKYRQVLTAPATARHASASARRDAPHDVALRRLFPSARLRALCSFDDLYVGLSPYEAPAVFSLLAAIELDEAAALDDPPRRDVGVYYPRGGFGTVVLVADGRATGVRLEGGETLDADYVVVNGDLATTEPALLSETTGAARSAYERERYSTSSITFLWALDAELPQLRHHNVFLAETGGGDDPFRVAWDDQLPAGRRRASGAASTSARRRSDPWTTGSRRAGGVFALRESAGCGDVAGHVVHERVIDPREWRDGLGLRRGSVFGLAHGLDQLAIFRPSRRSARVRGLAFVGASTRPGNGVPLVLTSATLLCAELEDELGLGGG
ncbi:all-trans-retinol 13,14-reductase [Aureococcus anophagefferens]|nr:all-trans-retinol 13,14-reductase [Aureococcus anophagefferens]